MITERKYVGVAMQTKNMGQNRRNQQLHFSTADNLLRSGLVGIWADREDITDSLEFARQLRYTAEHQSAKRLVAEANETTENK